MRVSVWVRKIIQVAMFYKTRIKSASRTLRVAPNKCPLKILPQPPLSMQKMNCVAQSIPSKEDELGLDKVRKNIPQVAF